jgi:hypothetical protein
MDGRLLWFFVPGFDAVDDDDYGRSQVGRYPWLERLSMIPLVLFCSYKLHFVYIGYTPLCQFNDTVEGSDRIRVDRVCLACGLIERLCNLVTVDQ